MALDLEIGNTIHNFEPGGEIHLLKRMQLQSWVEVVR